jgi:hypothetical protein
MSPDAAPTVGPGSQDRVVAVAVGAGLVTGLASTYPWELGAAVALPVWAVVGLVLGLAVGPTGRVVASGTGYGGFLALAFLYSRFGGEASDLPAYTVFVLAMAVAASLAGVLTVWLGARLRTRT